MPIVNDYISEVILPTGRVLRIEKCSSFIRAKTLPKWFVVAQRGTTHCVYEIARYDLDHLNAFPEWVVRAVRHATCADTAFIVRLDPWFIEVGCVATINHSVFKDVIPDRRKLFMAALAHLRFLTKYEMREAMILNNTSSKMIRMHAHENVWILWRDRKVLYDALD